MASSGLRVSSALPTVPAVLCLLWPTAASANGAMSLALATFTWTPWLVYVAVTILFEAIAMGRWLHLPFLHALKCSLTANFITAFFFGGFGSGIISYAFLGLFGTILNPNPFGQTLAVFTLFGMGSAALEALVWRGALKLPPPPPKEETIPLDRPSVAPKTVLLRCLVVHLAGVPLGLAVLLFPANPYPGLESQVFAHRMIWLGDLEMRSALSRYIAEHHSLPPVHSYEALLQLLRPNSTRYARDPGFWAAAYVPDYQRFDTGERRRHPFEWNPEASRIKLFEETEPAPSKQTQKTVWLIRTQVHDFYWGWTLDLSGGQVHRTTDPAELGYRDSPKPSGIP